MKPALSAEKRTLASLDWFYLWFLLAEKAVPVFLTNRRAKYCKTSANESCRWHSNENCSWKRRKCALVTCTRMRTPSPWCLFGEGNFQDVPSTLCFSLNDPYCKLFYRFNVLKFVELFFFKSPTNNIRISWFSFVRLLNLSWSVFQKYPIALACLHPSTIISHAFRWKKLLLKVACRQ